MSVRLKAGEDILPWVDTVTAAKYAGMSPRVLARLARKKRIRAGFDGRHWKFKLSFVDEFLTRGKMA